MVMYILEIIKCLLIQNIFFKEKPDKLYILGGGFVIFGALNICPFFDIVVIRLLMYLTVYTFMLLNVKGRFSRKLTSVLVMVCIIGCLDELAGIIIKPFFLVNNEYFYQIRSLIQSGISLIILMIINIIAQKAKVNHGKIVNFIRETVYIVIGIIIFLLLLTVGTLFFIKDSIYNLRLELFINIICFISFLCMGFLIILIAYIIGMNEEMEKAVETEHDLVNMQKKYYNILLEKEEDTRRYRHDMNNHLLCMMELAHERKVDLVVDYINGLQKELHYIKERSYKTGNELLDIIFNYYLKDLEDVDVQISGMCQSIPNISNVDLCIIFSNLIQNAVEAVARQKDKNKFIGVKIEQGKEYIKFRIKNSTDINPTQNHLDKIKTNKKDKKNHGFGLLNIKLAVEKNHGILEIQREPHTFEIILFFKYLEETN